MPNKDKASFSPDPAYDTACLRWRVAELEKKLTEQKKIEEKLRELTDLQGKILTFNKTSYEIEDLSEILYKIINNNSHVAWSEERTL